jgi:hypothetical protein
MKVDAELKRIALSMKLGQGPTGPKPGAPAQKREEPKKAPDSKDLARKFSDKGD